MDVDHSINYPALTPGIFVQRNNRFTGQVALNDGSSVTAYIPTTGRLSGVLQKDATVWLSYSDSPHRKTAYTLVLAELKHGGLCSVNAFLANQLYAKAVKHKHLDAFLYPNIENEITLGHSRLDFRLTQGAEVCWVEVKSVTYVEDGIGKFPDAPTARGKRHLETLAARAATGERASVVFICQREDASQFAPFKEIDPIFAEVLQQVHTMGVEVHAYRCKVSLKAIEIADEIQVLSLI